MDRADVAMMPPLARKGIEPHRFKGSKEVEEVRLVVSSRTKDLSLFWNHLKKGTLHYYLVDVHSIKRPVVGRTLGLLEDMVVVEDVKRRIGSSATTSFPSHRPHTKVVVLRDASQVEERSLYFSCKLREGVERSTLAAGLLQTAYRDWAPFRAVFDLIWPYLVSLPFPVVLVALQELAKTDPLVPSITNRFLMSALASMIFAQTISLQKCCFHLTYRFMTLGRFEWAAFDNRRWRHIIPFILHLIHAVVGTILLALWSELQTLRGGTTISRLFLVYFSLEGQLEFKVLLVLAVTLWAFTLSFSLSILHWIFGDNQELCLDTVLWLSRQGIIKPRRMPPTRLLVPLKLARISSVPRVVSSPRSTLTDTTERRMSASTTTTSTALGAVVKASALDDSSTTTTTTTPRNHNDLSRTNMAVAHAVLVGSKTAAVEHDPQNLDKPLRKEGPVR